MLLENNSKAIDNLAKYFEVLGYQILVSEENSLMGKNSVRKLDKKDVTKKNSR